MLLNSFYKANIILIPEPGKDTSIDAFTALITGQPFDLKQSIINNATANTVSAAFGEPIDAVTGAFFIHAIDFKMPDLQGEFVLKRDYTSTNKKVGPLGKGWTLDSR